MEIQIPDHIHEIYQKFSEAGFELYLVGGSVRNILLGKEPKDWDLTTNARPEEMTALFPDSFYDNQFGTVGIPFKSGDQTDAVYEITTFRSESEYTDHRHPEKVTWGKTLEEDLQRRDFTINAMAINVKHIVSDSPAVIPDLIGDPVNKRDPLRQLADRKDDVVIIDLYHGQEDLKSNLVRAVGQPAKRFKEDALRLMRAVRFATQLGFTIEESTKQAIIEDSMLLEHISTERIRDELLKILASESPYKGIMMLYHLELLKHFLPELIEGVGVSMVRPGRHHTADVFTHNLLALKECPSTDPIVRFATLIHDAGKPRVQGKDEDGYIIFYNHEIAGASMAYELCDRLHFSKKDKHKICKLIRWHMFTVDEHITDSAVRRFIRKIGIENVRDMIDLRIGDRLGSGTKTAESWRLKLFKDRIEEQLQPAPFSIKDLAIDGSDIMKELEIKPGPIIGKLLQQLFEEVDEDLEKNTKDYLLERIKQLSV